MAIDYKKWSMVGVGVGLISTGLAFAYNKLFSGGLGSITFTSLDVNVRNQIVSGQDTSLTSQLLNAFGGNLPAIPGGFVGVLITSVIGAILVTLIGRTLYSMVPIGKTANQRLAAVLLYGSVVSGFLVSLLSKTSLQIPTLSVVIAMAIYFLIVAFVYGMLSKSKGFGKFFPIPQ